MLTTGQGIGVDREFDSQAHYDKICASRVSAEEAIEDLEKDAFDRNFIYLKTKNDFYKVIGWAQNAYGMGVYWRGDDGVGRLTKHPDGTQTTETSYGVQFLREDPEKNEPVEGLPPDFRKYYA